MASLLSSMQSLHEKRSRDSVERIYTPAKISRVRWVQQAIAGETQGVQEANLAVTGSYSEIENSLDLWQYNERPNVSERYKNNTRDEDNLELGLRPDPIHTLPVRGDVTELKFLSPKKFLASTTEGVLGLYRVLDDDSAMEQLNSWDNTQMFCENEGFNGFDVFGGSVALTTTNGKIMCFAAEHLSNEPSCMIDHGKDGMRAVSFLTRNEIVAGNLRGQISVWDVRQDTFTPALSFPYNSEESVGVTQLVPFPTQKHILVGAGADGSLSTWDLRNIESSQTIFAAHRNHVTDLRFHDLRPGNAFSCSFAGDVWHWTNFAELLGASVSSTFKELSGKSPNVICLLPEKKFPANAIDVAGDQLVVAFDNDLLVFINNLQLR